MKGEGFKAHKKQGDKVKAGERIVTFDVTLCRQKAPGIVSAGKDVLFEAELAE